MELQGRKMSKLMWTDPETGNECIEDITNLMFVINTEEFGDLMRVDLVSLVLSQRMAGRPERSTILNILPDLDTRVTILLEEKHV